MANYKNALPSVRLVIRILVVVLAAVISQLVPFMQPYGVVVVAIAAITVTILPSVQEFIEGYLEERAILTTNTRYMNEIRNFISERLSQPNSSMESIRERLTRQEIYLRFLEESFPGLSTTKKNAFLLLCFCRQTEQSLGAESVDVYSTIQRYIEILGLHRITRESKIVFAAYHRFFKTKEKFAGIDDLFRTLPLQVTKGLQKEFLERFSKDAPFMYVRRELRQSEELRRTLLELVKTGQLNAYGVKEEALQHLKDEFSRTALSRGAFLILGNKIPREVKEKFRTYPNLGGFMAWSHVPNIRPVRITGFIIKPNKHFISPREFFTKEVQPLIETQDRDMILVIFSLDILNLESYVHPPTADFASEFMQDCFSSIRHITEGYAEEASIWTTISNSKITIEELLSIIPFNIFVPDIVESERELILKNYSQIKQRLSVKKLPDWKDHKPSDIVKVLLSLGRPSYKESEAFTVFGTSQLDKISELKLKKRLRNISAQIVTNSRRFSRSLRF